VGSLYPIATVILARAILDERVRAVQAAGVVAALAGVALIAAG
jgi:drug/metabolite transporter (DMT)-like permease